MSVLKPYMRGLRPMRSVFGHAVKFKKGTRSFWRHYNNGAAGVYAIEHNHRNGWKVVHMSTRMEDYIIKYGSTRIQILVGW